MKTNKSGKPIDVEARYFSSTPLSSEDLRKLKGIMNEFQKALGREPIPCTCDKAFRNDKFVDCDGKCEMKGGEG